MKRHQVRQKAESLIKSHLPGQGWRFEFNNARRSAGICSYNEKTIYLSQYLLPHMKEEKIVDTILHEIAHAIAGFDAGHGYKWKRIPKSIGCNGYRCYDPRTAFKEGSIEKLAKQSKYTLTCPSCGKKSPKHRKPKSNYSCGDCSNGRYNPDYKLVLTQNY